MLAIETWWDVCCLLLSASAFILTIATVYFLIADKDEDS